MWFALLRGSFWLAALAVGLALFVPGEHRVALTGAVAVAGLLAAATWRCGWPQKSPARSADARPPEVPPIALPALNLAAAQIEAACARASTLDAALHDVAAILKSELGAEEAHASRIASVDGGQVLLARVVACADGLRKLPPMPADAGGPCAIAVRNGRCVLAVPDAIALPVAAGDDGGGLVELVNLHLAIDATALADLLERSALALAAVAARHPLALEDVADAGLTLFANRRILLLQEGDDSALATALERLGMRVTRSAPHTPSTEIAETQCDLVLVDVDADVNAAGGATCPQHAALSDRRVARLAVSSRHRPEDEALYVQRGFDALICSPFDGGRLAAMLTRFLGAAPCQAADEAAGGGARRPPTTPLDAAALARLADLDLMRQVAHTLKSSSAAIGAVKFSQLCAEIETMIRSDRTEGLTTRAEAMRGESEFVLQAVKKLLDSGP
jgi:CheY-like chemotaxis protein